MLFKTHSASFLSSSCLWIALPLLIPYWSDAASQHSIRPGSFPFFCLFVSILLKLFAYFTFRGIIGISFIVLLCIALFNSVHILTDQEDSIYNALGYAVDCLRWYKEINRSKSNKGRMNLFEFFVYMILHLYANSFCIFFKPLHYSDIWLKLRVKFKLK